MVQKTSLNSRNRLAEKIKTNFIRTIPVMTGYLVLAIGFGILLQTQGLGFIPAVAMSVFIYAGSMQFVAANLIVTGAGLATAAGRRHSLCISAKFCHLRLWECW